MGLNKCITCNGHKEVTAVRENVGMVFNYPCPDCTNNTLGHYDIITIIPKPDVTTELTSSYEYIGDYMMARNVNVYGLDESIVASAYPKQSSTPTEMEYNGKVELSTQDIIRAEKLGNVAQGTGHDCFLKGIVVQADFTFSQYMWQQAKRYHWFDFVSSQSTMHRIVDMEITKQCNPHVDPRVVAILEELIEKYIQSVTPYDRDLCFHRIIANIPSGMMLTARITTNYLQLKTMYHQRKSHKMTDWIEFNMFCEKLPRFTALVPPHQWHSDK